MTDSELLWKCDHCGATEEGLKRCTGCHNVLYCGSQCQKQAWPSHQVQCACASQINRWVQVLSKRPPERRTETRYAGDQDNVKSPYEDGLLPKQLQEDVLKIRKALRRWLALSEAWHEGSEDKLIQATVDLVKLQLDPDHIFHPQPKPVFRRTFTTMIKTYWLALLPSFDPVELDEMSRRIDLLPPYGKFPVLSGEKCIRRPGELSARELEWLMRGNILAVLSGLAPDDVVVSWRELADTAVPLWEEDRDLKRK